MNAFVIQWLNLVFFFATSICDSCMTIVVEFNINVMSKKEIGCDSNKRLAIVGLLILEKLWGF